MADSDKGAEEEKKKDTESKTNGRCFIIMPITTPSHVVERYKGDEDHFIHVLDHLFIPALKEAGFTPIPPKSEGSNIIHADIIKQLSECELVLCDMSILNPNVFFEFGIRTALNKSVALVVDDKTDDPFDTGIINFHKYDSSLAPWILEEQKQKLTKHIQDVIKKSKDYNALWKYFCVAQIGTFKPEDVEMGEKFDFIMQELATIKIQLKHPQAPTLADVLEPLGVFGDRPTPEKERDDMLRQLRDDLNLKYKLKYSKTKKPDSNNL